MGVQSPVLGYLGGVLCGSPSSTGATCTYPAGGSALWCDRGLDRPSDEVQLPAPVQLVLLRNSNAAPWSDIICTRLSAPYLREICDDGKVFANPLFNNWLHLVAFTTGRKPHVAAGKTCGRHTAHKCWRPQKCCCWQRMRIGSPVNLHIRRRGVEGFEVRRPC